jgi:serine/threonine-protein kinase
METLVDSYISNREESTPVVSGDCGLVSGRYRFVRPLGAGGMGNVYLADDVLLARPVAVKTIRPELSGNTEVRARIKREYRMHAAIGAHPHIITLYDTVEEYGHIYLVMEYFAGETLSRRLSAAAGSSCMPLDQVLGIIRQLLRALECIHDRGIVHRDIKTSNILLKFQENDQCLAKLTDFGIARAGTEPDNVTRLTSLGTQGPGTPVYMAPERIDPQTYGEICPATDLYAVGIILYELLTGAPPFKGAITEIFSGHLVQQPALDELPAGITADVKTVLNKVLAKKPVDRYQNTASFLDALAVIDSGGKPSSFLVGAQDATLLAPESKRAAVAPCEATILNPNVGRTRSLSIFNRKWLYGFAILVAVLVGYFLSNRLTKEQVSQSAPPSTKISAPAAAPAITAPVIEQSPDHQTAEKLSSALQAVEDARQPKIVESVPPVDQKSTGTADKQEWRVIENHSRKIN